MEKSEPASSELEALRSELLEEKREFAVPGSKKSKLSVATRALRHRNFQLFFSGQLISLIGTWMHTVAHPGWFIASPDPPCCWAQSRSAARFPSSSVAPIGGIVADRYNRHRIVIATQTAFHDAGVHSRGAHADASRARLADHGAGRLLGGVINAFDIPARQAFIVEMVGREDLINAIALNSVDVQRRAHHRPRGRRHPVAAMGEGWCFFANAVSYIAVIAGLLLMKLPAHRERLRETSPLEDMLEGFRSCRDAAPIRAILLLLGLVSLAGMPYAVLMPIFAAQILHGGAKALGMLMGATGVGALLGAVSLAARVGVRGLGRLIAFCAAGFGVSLIAFSFSRIFWLSALLLIPVGFCMMVQMASSNTLMQSMVPDRCAAA